MLKLTNIKTLILIAVSFLLTSTGWLAWEYHLMEFTEPHTTDVMTMVVGYLLQAVGIGLYALMLVHRPTLAGRIAPAVYTLYVVCLIPAVISPYVAGVLTFGFITNILCGIIAGLYLLELCLEPGDTPRATVFGFGYALSILLSWLLAAIGGGILYRSWRVIVVCAGLSLMSVFIIHMRSRDISGDKERAEAAPGADRTRTSGIAEVKDHRLILTLAALVILFGIVSNCGFAFSSADIVGHVNVELSRLVYAVSLVIAGIVTDIKRVYGALLAFVSLIVPFITLSLSGESLPAVVFWLIGYFTFGFYSVYRIILFSDLSLEKRLLSLSGMGLMTGRAGDAAGELLCILFGSDQVVIVALAAVFFVLSSILFFVLYQQLYVPKTAVEMNEKEKFYHFSMTHDLSSREQDMLRLILEEKTVSEIGADLSISDNTVKYHVKNILQKTGFKSRKDLIAAYRSSFL